MADEPTPVIETIDDNAPGANMYGCQPCPKCGRRYRYPDQDNVLRCDDCGYLARWRLKADRG